MKRMHFKKNKKNKSVNIIILLIILLTISIVYLFKIFNQKLLPQLLNYSQIETKKIVSSIINTTSKSFLYSKSVPFKLTFFPLFIL